VNIEKQIIYSVYGKTTTSEPCLVQAKPDETVQGTVTFPGNMSTFDGRLYRTSSPTGSNPYVLEGSNFFTGSIAGLTGVAKECSFVVDLSQVNAPTGAQSGELYALKILAGYTGIFGTKSVADVIITVKAEVQ
jgi:hypothetical protein